MNQVRRKADWERCILRPFLLDSKPVTLSASTALQPTDSPLTTSISLPLCLLCPLPGMPSPLLSSVHLPPVRLSSSPPDHSRLPPSLLGSPCLLRPACACLSSSRGNPGPQPCHHRVGAQKTSETAEELELRDG